MLIAFISVALVTATVYSVEAFDSAKTDYAENAILVESLKAELAEKDAMTDSLKQAAELTEEREKALADILEKQRQESKEETKTITVSSEPAKKTTYNTKQPYNPYRQRYWGWVPRKTYVV